MTPPRVSRLQAWMVRLMVDPDAVRQVHAGPVKGLPEPDRALLCAVDARAWSTDTHRRARLLTAVLEELPVTGALLGPVGADAFFSSPDFVRVLTDYGSMTLAFGRWATPRAGPLAALDLALAKARRPEPVRGEGIATSPGVVVLSVPEGTVQAWADARMSLGDRPVDAIVAGARVSPPRLGRRPAWALTTAGGPESIPQPLYQLLTRCASPRPLAHVVADAARLGAGADAASLVDGWIAEGLLVHALESA